ncbi:putative transporter mfs2 [Grifola frondosa]|uniref:Putative transporter mfs2 n=1 Tax=Grifola frondosa TaxID=5627 RepID=A0A1C7MMG7_GRIFR|nr:putative transporter mfs2 [Grifola frondosa]
MATVSTPRSSTSTIFDPVSARSALVDEELRREELRIEGYGGDDPQEPPQKRGESVVVLPELKKTDLNKVAWDGPDDPENPQNWPSRRKWVITVLCLVMTVNVTFASSAPSAGALFIAQEMHKTAEVGYLVTSVFLIGYVPIFRITLVCYTILHLGQALAKNIETLLVTRFLGGFFAVAPLTNCGGVIVDIWDPITRGTATAMFSAGVFLGPVLGPIAGGFLAESFLGWRWIFWIMMIFAGTCTAIAIIFLPETFAPVLLQKKAQRLRKADPKANADVYAEHEKADWSLKGIIHRTLYRPIQMLMMEPILVLVTIYLSLVYGVLYALFEALPVIFIVPLEHP